MVSDTTLIVVATVAQTVVITLTLLVFIFQFRSQEKAIKDAAYQNVMSHYTDYVRMLVEDPKLARLLVQAENPASASLQDLSPEDQSLAAYMLLGYGIFEEIFTLHKKKWVDEASWQQWYAFLDRYSSHPLFTRVYELSKGTFDPEFEEMLAAMLAKHTEDRAKSGSGGGR